eukprot:403341123
MKKQDQLFSQTLTNFKQPFFSPQTSPYTSPVSKQKYQAHIPQMGQSIYGQNSHSGFQSPESTMRFTSSRIGTAQALHFNQSKPTSPIAYFKNNDQMSSNGFNFFSPQSSKNQQKFNPEQSLQDFYKSQYLTPSQSQKVLPYDPNERIKKIKLMSNFKQSELQQTFSTQSLPVLNKFQRVKKQWEKLEHSDLKVENEVLDPTFKTVQESMMYLDNNKMVHGLIKDQLKSKQKFALEEMIKLNQTGAWQQSRMPKVKKVNKFFSRRSSNNEFGESILNFEEEGGGNDIGQIILEDIRARRQNKIVNLTQDKDKKSIKNGEKEVSVKDQQQPELNEIGNPQTIQLTKKELSTIKFYWQVKQNVWFPPIRIGSTMVQCGNKIFIFGGIGNCALNDIYSLDLKTAKWGPVQVKSKRPLHRYGHSAGVFKGKIFIFGGENKYNPEVKMRETLCDLWIFDQRRSEFKQIHMGNKLICEPRKDHVMAIYGHTIFIQGGVNTRVTNEWFKVNIKGDGPGEIAFHQCAAVQRKERRSQPAFDLFKHPDIRYEGIYFFGGKLKNGFLSNTLRFLRTGKKQLEWQTLDTKGKQPCARYSHSMEFSEEQSLIVVFGGRCDLQTRSSSGQQVLNDIWVLLLSTLIWCEVQAIGQKPQERFSHCSTIVGTQLIIFGGIHKNFCSADLHVLEMDPFYAKKANENDREFKKKKEEEYNNLDQDTSQMLRFEQAMTDMFKQQVSLTNQASPQSQL